MAAAGVGLVVGLAKLAVGGGGHLFGIGADAESELLLEGVALGEDVVAYLLGLGRNLGIDFAQARLLLLGQAYSLTLEALIMLFEHHLLLASKCALVCVPDGCDALVEGLVEGDVGLVVAEQGDGFLHNSIKGVAAVGFGHIVEHALHFAEDASREFERQDGVLEGRSLGICGDGVDFSFLLLYAGLDGGDVVGNFYLVERRNSVGSVPFLKEGVGVIASHKQNKRCKQRERAFHGLVDFD